MQWKKKVTGAWKLVNINYILVSNNPCLGNATCLLINTQCQIKNKQLLCFSQYLQPHFNYFDPIQGGNEELGARDVDKLWQFLHCVLIAASASASIILIASHYSHAINWKCSKMTHRNRANRTWLALLIECHILDWGTIVIKRKHANQLPKPWMFSSAGSVMLSSQVCTFWTLHTKHS